MRRSIKHAHNPQHPLKSYTLYPLSSIPSRTRCPRRRPCPRPTPPPLPPPMPILPCSTVIPTVPPRPVIPSPRARRRRARPSKDRLPHHRIIVIWKIHIHQVEVIVQHIRILKTTPPPIFIYALHEDFLRLLHLVLEVLELRHVEGRIAAVSLVEAVARQALDVLCVVMKASSAQFFEVASDLAACFIENPIPARLVSALWA